MALLVLPSQPRSARREDSNGDIADTSACIYTDKPVDYGAPHLPLIEHLPQPLHRAGQQASEEASGGPHGAMAAYTIDS
jgi:hypothetical protein